MTELNDHLKLLFARAANLFDKQTALAGAARHAGDDLRRPAATIEGRPAAGLHFPRRAAGQHHARADRAVAVSQRLLARAGRARGRRQEAARRGGRPLPPRQRREGAGDGGHRAGAQARQRSAQCLQAERRGRTRTVALFDRVALPGERPTLCRSAAGAVQLQLGLRRLRDLPRLRPRHRRRPGAGDPRPAQDAAQRRHQDHHDAGLGRDPRRPAALCGRGRHPARHRLEPAHRRASATGC